MAVMPVLTPNPAVAGPTLAAHHDEVLKGSGGEHAEGPDLPKNFQDRLAIGNLSEPSALAFAPDGTAFIGLKTGIIKSVDYDAATRQFEPFVTSNDFADLSDVVHNYWDRGLTGITLDPRFGQAGHNFVYVNYSYNRDPRDTPPIVPKWETGQGQYDGCPDPAAMPTGDDPAAAGCVVTTRVSRLTATAGPDGWVMTGAELPLLEAGCMQFQSHASGDVRVGPDGWLYASAGDGASFDVEDLGQAGNPCADPANEGGALRSQDARTSGDDLGLGGAIYRINPANGAAPDGSDDNSERLVAYGQRNPWRFTFRPGTSELWSADVGSSGYEEINRIGIGSFTSPVNRGWPCYEGRVGASTRNQAWDALDLPLCESLYAEGPAAVEPPAFAYRTRGGAVAPGEHCRNSTGSISGVAFTPATSNYPGALRRALFFSDYARRCIWRLGKKPDGSPDPTKVSVFAQNASTPVDLMAGPGGDLFYVDYGLNQAGVPQPQAGAVRRITYRDPTPLASIVADRASAPRSHRYRFSAVRSTDPKGRTLKYSWDLDGNGTFETNTGRKPTARKRYAHAENVLVSVRVKNSRGKVGLATMTVYADNNAPSIRSLTPGPGLKWRVGQRIDFAADATDADEALSDVNYEWNLTVRHCPKACHTHPIGAWPYQRSGSLVAPSHEFPSHLLLSVAVTDSRGMRVERTVRLDPRAVRLRFGSVPSQLLLTAGGEQSRTRFDRTFIRGALLTVSAPVRQRRQGVTYAFTRWSDRGPRIHEVTANKKRKLTAKYVAVTAQLRLDVTPGALRVRVEGRSRRAGSKQNFTVGEKVKVAAPRVQVRKGVRWVFVGWSDGRPRVHKVKIGKRRVDLQARYRRG